MSDVIVLTATCARCRDTWQVTFYGPTLPPFTPCMCGKRHDLRELKRVSGR